MDLELKYLLVLYYQGIRANCLDEHPQLDYLWVGIFFFEILYGQKLWFIIGDIGNETN